MIPLLLNVAGLAIVTAYLLVAWVGGAIATWVGAVAVVALLAWAARLVVPSGRAPLIRVLCLVMAVAAGVTAWPTDGLMIIPVIPAVLWMTRSPEHSAAWGYSAALTAAALVAGTPILLAANGAHPPSVESIVSLELAVLIALLGGVNRRQARARDLAAAELVERTDAMRLQEARAATLTARQELARDMHDVLAHSLGALVIQLDAVEAQLEAGTTGAALTRLHDARAMAASGLAEARRAVETLRSGPDSGSSVRACDIAADLVELVDAHERLGGGIRFEQHGAQSDLPEPVAVALRRALQESLSNARKHAPGQPVDVCVWWQPDRVRIEVTNPLAPGGPRDVPVTASGSARLALAATGSGSGLAGMRERFGALPGGAVRSGARGGRFEVCAEAAIPAGPGEAGGDGT